MNLQDYDFDRLLGLGYTEKATGELKDACWKGYTAIGLKKKGGRTVPNCVPVSKSKSDHAEEMKRKPMIAGPSAGSPSFAEPETDDFAQCVKPDGSTYGTKGDCQPPNKPLHHSLKKTEKKKDEKMCAKHQPWAPLGMQNVVVPCKELGYAEHAEEVLDFARCQRPDGSVYGTAGKCRKGSEIADLEKRIARQERFLKTADPSKFSRREIEIEKKELQRLKSQLAGMKSTTRNPVRRAEEDVKRGNTLIGTSPRNKLIDNINSFKARLKDARSDAERELLEDTIRKAEAQLKAEGG